MRDMKKISITTASYILMTVCIPFGMSGCQYQNSYKSYERDQVDYRAMKPADLEYLDERELESVCQSYISKADATRDVRYYSPKGFKFRDVDIRDKIYTAGRSNPLADKKGREKTFEMFDQINDEIAQLEREMEIARSTIGRCFDIGLDGRKFKEKYLSEKEKIAELRDLNTDARQSIIEMYTAVDEAKQRDLEWREKNAQLLTYEDDRVKVRIKNIKVFTQNMLLTEFIINVTSSSKSYILHPYNTKLMVYDTQPEIGGLIPWGAHFKDNFNNNFNLIGFTPEYYSGMGRGIRPDETVEFKIHFSGYPVDTAKSVSLIFDGTTFDQKRKIEFVIPIDVFYKRGRP